MATLSEIRSRVRLELGEPSAGYWTDAHVDACINSAAAQFSVDTGLLLVPPRRTDILAGSALYTLPDDCPGPQAVVSVICDGVELEAAAPAAILRLGGKPHSDSGRPSSWYFLADGGDPCLALYPVPSSSIPGGIVIWYWTVSYTHLTLPTKRIV